ncbi:MAG TPA: o-succinylbenzoate synthase, partial [Ktedonobacteraceae bacterium]|nr:o-succinylbenzoate synthase [Ktedonobacteraceae bacterium]
MKLIDLTWRPYQVPFRHPFVTAHGILGHRRGALVQIRLENGSEGSGEIAPLPEFAGSNLANILSMLPGLAKDLYERETTDILSFLASQCQDGLIPAPLIYGLETALLDALAQTDGSSLAAFLANVERVRKTIPVNAVISGETIEVIVDKAQAALAAGFTCLKLKVTQPSPRVVEYTAALRAISGPAPRLRLDVNEGWNFEQARSLLTQCAAYDIEYVEQPLPADDREGMARLRRATPIPLAADEAVYSLEQARNLLAMEAADVLILKPQMLGGFQLCRQIIGEAQKRQVHCVVTSTLDTGIGVAAA